MPEPGTLRALADIDLTEQGRLALLKRQYRGLRALAGEYNDACQRVAQHADAYRRGAHAGTDYMARLLDNALDDYRRAADAYLGPADDQGMRHG